MTKKDSVAWKPKLIRKVLGVWGLVDANLYIEELNNNVLYSTGNSTQDPVINHNGKEYEK